MTPGQLLLLSQVHRVVNSEPGSQPEPETPGTNADLIMLSKYRRG